MEPRFMEAADAQEPLKVPLPTPLGGDSEASASKLLEKPSSSNGKAKSKPKDGDADAPAPKAKAKAKKGSGKGKAKSSHFRLNVRNLHVSITTDKLIELFEPHGKVVQAQVRTHEDGTSRTIGFVTFSTEEEAMSAMEKMGGKTVKGKALKIEPAELKPSAMEMQAHQQQDFRQKQAQAYMAYMTQMRQLQMSMMYSGMVQAQMQQAALAAAYMQQAAAAESAEYDEDGDAAETFDPAAYGEMGMWPSASGAEWGNEALYGDMSSTSYGSWPQEDPSWPQ